LESARIIIGQSEELNGGCATPRNQNLQAILQARSLKGLCYQD